LELLGWPVVPPYLSPSPYATVSRGGEGVEYRLST